jgi:myo-inositol-1(or 4)-monophosphatase
MFNASANMNLMVRAARKAARGLLRDFGEVENLLVSTKGPGDFVTRADRKAEDVIRTELAETRPNYGWLGEETGSAEGKDPTRRWIVDPLDGTTNFLHGLPHWAISIALEFRGEIVAAVVYDPIKDEMFTAEKGNGAWMNNRRLRVSVRKDMIEMLFATGLPFAGNRELPAVLADLGKVLPASAGVRRWGAAALDMAYVAAGRLDGYWERSINAWDIAAGVLLVREAGGLIGDMVTKSGNPLESGQVLVANPHAYERLLDALAPHIDG